MLRKFRRFIQSRVCRHSRRQQAPKDSAFTPPAGAKGLGIQPVDIPGPAGDGKEHVVPEVVLSADGAGSQSNGPYPATIPQEYVNDPNYILREAIADQDILGTITIQLSTTTQGSGIENIPFLGTANPAQPSDPSNANAFVLQSSATFWIEWVRLPYGGLPTPLAKPLDPSILGIEPFWPDSHLLATAVLAGVNPGFQQRFVAARERCHAHTERRLSILPRVGE